MSFILDALKKSETERQRGDGPALHEMKMAPPRQGVATWLIVLAGLLVINIVVLSVVLLRGTHGAPAPSDAGTVAAPATPAPAPVALAPPTPAPTVIIAPPAPTPAAAEAPVTPPPATAAAQNPAATDDDIPAVEPPRTASGVQATGGSSGELPTYQQAATAPGANLPELALNLHSYSTNPAERFIFLNMTKLREGQSSPQGIRVETITPDGAILSWQGSKFLLQRQ
jgi:general secretion pathway protein B